jgi:hypothetical protein
MTKKIATEKAVKRIYLLLQFFLTKFTAIKFCF